MTFIIAEAGVNHNGSYIRACELLEAAKECGADAVKFQLFNSQELWGDDRIKHLELSERAIRHIHAGCKRVGIEFMCTPFSVEAVEFLTPLVKRHKIASGCRKPEILEAVAKSGLPVIVSMGMADKSDLMALIHKCSGVKPFVFLHCTSSYPCELEHVNLSVIKKWLTVYAPEYVQIGFSDHTQGIIASIAAVAMGATVIEKHLTLDKTAEGPDHKSSIEPNEFKTMVEAIREVEVMLGDGVKRVLPCEEKLRELWYD